MVWRKLYPTSLPNNNSGIDCVMSPDGVPALVYNPVSSHKRTPLQVSFSRDNGITWESPVVLQEGEGEFSYPSVIYNKDRFCICYTGKRKTIHYAEITDDLILS